MFSRVARVRTLAICVLAAIAAICSATASANEVSNVDSQLMLETPVGWQVDQGDVMVLTSPDGAAYVYFWALDAEDVDGAAKNLAASVGTILEKVKVVDHATKAEVGGLATVRASGTGTVQGIAVVWTAVVAKGKDRPAMILGFAGKDGWKANAAAFDAIAGSVRSTK